MPNVSEPAGRSTAALRGTDLLERAVAPTMLPDVSPQPVRTGHGKTRPFRLGATFVPDPQPELEPGTILGAQERYRLVRFLGQGGMGRVYEARRERDGRPVALKVLRTDRVTGNADELIARFRQEASAASRVGHPGIIETLGFERAPDGRVMIAMALMQGETLEDWMSSEGTLAEGLTHVAGVCEALHAAHEAGIVHRDIKPENLYLHREDGQGEVRPTVLDFGLAKVEVPDHTQIETAAGTVLGTPYYLAPERALGKPLDRRADLYSLGVVLYELVCGVLPFDAGAFMAVLEGHVRRVPLDPRQAAPQRPIPAEVSALVMSLLEKDPASRPSTAQEVADRIRALLDAQASALEACPTGPRSTASPDADTMSMLALAAGHTAAPGASAVSAPGAATIAPVDPGAVTIAPADTVAVSRSDVEPGSRVGTVPSGTAPRGRLGLFVGLGAVVGALAVVAAVGLSPDAPSESSVQPPTPEPVAAPAVVEPPPPPAEPAAVPSPPAAAPPSEPTPPEPAPSATPPDGGTNAPTVKRSRRRKPKAAPPPATPSPEPSLPAFKDDIYED